MVTKCGDSHISSSEELVSCEDVRLCELLLIYSAGVLFCYAVLKCGWGAAGERLGLC